ncbi:MAG: ribonuclease H-like domain-containing protein [Thermodesulfovibrionales bacterium]|nr:ribonuclease H-like domain-containing protein [Thermodesulfovibrionales bacterium]
MIRNTFSILNGIGERLERRLWKKGITTWDDFIRADDIDFIPIDTKIRYDLQLLELMEKLQNQNLSYLCKVIKRREHWRFFEIFKDGSLCLDIETNGLKPEEGGYITVIGIYNGKDYHALVRGFDLEPHRIKHLIEGHKCLITFNGSIFDIPFLKKCYPSISFDIPHFDLSFAARRLGLNGGLKTIERSFHISRDYRVANLNGYDAVMLWKQWQSGREEALDLLVEYNKADTVNLMRLAEEMYPLLKQATGFDA